MPRPIAFDLTRLFVGAAGATPRGIDRVDLSFARRLFDDPGAPHVGLVPGPFRMGQVSRSAARLIVAEVEQRWRETVEPQRENSLETLRHWLAGETVAVDHGSLPARSVWRGVRHIVAMLRRSCPSLVSPAGSSLPKGAIYLNTGQVLLGAPWFFGWLDGRPDVKPVFTLHDLIPLTHPEYSGPLLSRHHARALETVARRAAALLATSHSSASEICRALKALGRCDIPVHIAPLPVSPTLRVGTSGAAAAEFPYFVTVGILDQRKNHRLLLHVWRDMLRRLGPGIPKLIAIGPRGLRTAELHALLARSPGLDSVVRVASGLPSPAMRSLVAGARGLLMPSFAEGFGLPIIEAAALGVPVIASDIPAHREAAAASDAVLLDPTDGPGWTEAVLRLAGRDRSGEAPDTTAVQTWDRYFDSVLPWLETL